eukprot:gene7112-9706_t
MSDSEDDIPIAVLMKRRSIADKNGSNTKKIATEANVKTIKKDSGSTTKTTSKSSNSSSHSGALSNDFYNITKKGYLVQQLLVRWWYAIQWPKPEEIGEVPPGYESLEGFEGVYISTRTDTLGRILDLRNKDNSPCLTNLSKYTSAKLKELCIKAIEEQIKQLREHEGDDTALEPILKDELKTVKNIDPASADKEAKKYSF